MVPTIRGCLSFFEPERKHKQLLIKCWQYMTCTVTQVFFVMNGFKLKLTTSEFVLLLMARKFNWRTGSKTILHVYNEFLSSGLTHVNSQNISYLQDSMQGQYYILYYLHTYLELPLQHTTHVHLQIMFAAHSCPTAPLSAMGKYLKSLFWRCNFRGDVTYHSTWYLHVSTHLVNLSLL